MNATAILDDYGVLAEPATLTLERLLPGPVERVWAYLTDGELRKKWLADGVMELSVGAPFTLTWRNDELDGPASPRPDGFGEEHSMPSRITELDPMRRLSFEWRGSGDVTFELSPTGKDVLLTITHRRLPDRDTMLMIAAGWHAHVDVLAGLARGEPAAPFWSNWQRLRADYAERLPG